MYFCFLCDIKMHKVMKSMEEKLYDYIEISDLKDMLNKTKKIYADKPAYKLRGKKSGTFDIITHKEVRDMVDALGTSLIKMGLKGKRIAVIGENRYEWEIAYLAVTCGTGIVAPIDKSLPENELKSLIERSGVEAIIYSGKYEEGIKRIKEEGIGKLKYFISMDLKEEKDVIYFSEIQEAKESIGIIIALTGYYQREVVPALLEKGYTNLYIV